MTSPSWKLQVKNFGPIGSADVCLAPLVVFVGKNNTGKSYLTSLLWGILDLARPRGASALTADPSFLACRRLIKRLITQETTKITRRDWKTVLNWINRAMNNQAKGISSRLLASDECEYDSLALTPTVWPGDLSVSVEIVSSERTRARNYSAPRVVANDSVMTIRVREGDLNQDSLITSIATRLVSHIVRGSRWFSPIYIPAARTGLMLAFRTLISGLFRTLELEDDEEDRATLPAPVVSFLEELNYFMIIGKDEVEDGDKRHPHDQLADEIEQSIVKGAIERVEGKDGNDFRYIPVANGKPIPLYAASSLVTEIVPFIILLRSGLERQTVFFEEPEAHLHLSAQRAIARALVRLVNSGAQVVITTHSDTLLQQINICLQLYDHPKRELLIQKLGYREDECLSPAHAKGYLFDDHDKNGTLVRELRFENGGFVESVMNEEIVRMNEEIQAIENEY